jgi:hypothetical protein
MSPDYPDEELNKYIYEYSAERDAQLSNWSSIKKMYPLLGWLFYNLSMLFMFTCFINVYILLTFPSRPTI